LTELKFEELPDIPGIWVDFLESRLPSVPASRRIHALIAHANALRDLPTKRADLCRILEDARDLCSDKTREKLHLLRQPGSVVILTNFYPGLFGGQAYQILKCLTAIKVCEELAQHGLTAIPVCWISASSPPDFSMGSIQLLDSESEIHCLQLQQSGRDYFSPSDILPWSQVRGLLSQIEGLGAGVYDPEVIEVLKGAFARETTFAQASARLAFALLEEWGMVVVNPHAPDFQSIMDQTTTPLPACIIQCSVLPVLADVRDPYEVFSYVEERQTFAASKRIQPMLWPQASATIVDARSRRTLERYNLDLHQLYSGDAAIIGGLADGIPHEASAKLFNLRQEAEDRIATLGILGPAGSDFGKAMESAREKIVFQLDRLRKNFDAACKSRQETINRRVRRTCNALAPNGRIQERELACIQLPLRYSRAILRSLYEKLDVLSLEHQLIYMD
jgi:uncharacterized protein YllA (UPF0747 family)